PRPALGQPRNVARRRRTCPRGKVIWESSRGEKDVSQDREVELLARVPADGSGIGNGRLLRELGWGEEEFWEVRNRLVDRGVLEVGRGRGGSVRRIDATTATLTTGIHPSDVPAPVEHHPEPER